MSSPQQPPAPPTASSAKDSSADVRLELYKLEYERAAIRYEDIYKAIWQIFQYLAAISGALLAFGSERFEQHWFGFLLSLPLFFWFVATYWPLDRYGNFVLQRLEEIEGTINKLYGTELAHFTRFKKKRSGFRGYIHRVKPKVNALAILLGLFMIWNLVVALRTGEPWNRQKRTNEVKIITVAPEDLGKLLEEEKPSDNSRVAPKSREKKP